jgi:hypothetical protein
LLTNCAFFAACTCTLDQHTCCGTVAASGTHIVTALAGRVDGVAQHAQDGLQVRRRSAKVHLRGVDLGLSSTRQTPHVPPHTRRRTTVTGAGATDADPALPLGAAGPGGGGTAEPMGSDGRYVMLRARPDAPADAASPCGTDPAGSDGGGIATGAGGAGGDGAAAGAGTTVAAPGMGPIGL